VKKFLFGLLIGTVFSSVAEAADSKSTNFSRLETCALAKIRADFHDPNDKGHVETDGVNRLFGILYSANSDGTVESNLALAQVYDPNSIFLGKKITRIMNFESKQAVVIEFEGGKKDGIVFSTGPWPGRPGMMVGQVIQQRSEPNYNIDSYMFMGRCIPSANNAQSDFDGLKNKPSTFSAIPK